MIKFAGAEKPCRRNNPNLEFLARRWGVEPTGSNKDGEQLDVNPAERASDRDIALANPEFHGDAVKRDENVVEGCVEYARQFEFDWRGLQARWHGAIDFCRRYWFSSRFGERAVALSKTCARCDQ